MAKLQQRQSLHQQKSIHPQPQFMKRQVEGL